MPETTTQTIDFETTLCATVTIERTICENPHDSEEYRALDAVSLGGEPVHNWRELRAALMAEIETLDIEPGQPEPELLNDRLARIEAENRDCWKLIARLKARLATFGVLDYE